MGCCNSKKQEKPARDDAPAKAAHSPAPVMTPTDSMRADHHYPESLNSYEPASYAEEQIRQERERLRRQLDMQLAAQSGSSKPKGNGHGKDKSSSGSSTDQGGSTSGGKSQAPAMKKEEYRRMSQDMQEEIKSKSSSMQSQRQDTSEGDKPIVVHATLHRAKGPPANSNSVSRPPSLLMLSTQPPPNGQSSKPSNESPPVPRLLSFEKHRAVQGAVRSNSKTNMKRRPSFGSLATFPGTAHPPHLGPGGVSPQSSRTRPPFGSQTRFAQGQNGSTQPVASTKQASGDRQAALPTPGPALPFPAKHN